MMPCLAFVVGDVQVGIPGVKNHMLDLLRSSTQLPRPQGLFWGQAMLKRGVLVPQWLEHFSATEALSRKVPRWGDGLMG